MLAPGTGYIRLQEFSETSDSELGDALRKLKAEGMQRLVFDLRDNPGGPLDQAIAVANRFLKKGQIIVSTRGRLPNSDEDYRASVEGGYTDVPLIMLVNRGSASASEIVTGAMQDHDRGFVIGETTFGKALVQSVYPISQRRRPRADDGPVLHAERSHDPAPLGRQLRRVPDRTASTTSRARTRIPPPSCATRTAIARSTAEAGSSPTSSSGARWRGSTRRGSRGC